MATPRKSAYTIPDTSAPWTLRSAGGTRPAVIVWGTPAPSEAVLDRLARAGFAVLTPPLEAGPADLEAAVARVPPPLGVAFLETPAAGLSQLLDARRIPWLHVSGNWDDVPRWFAERGP